ncbi:MAG: ImmA/IrrE family metallo-endopeptidase [Candidatus Gastranaerophilaceae bacterium]
MQKTIVELVSYYIRKYNTRNPFEIADHLGILYQIGNIGCAGCYMFLKNHRYIFLSQDLEKHELKMVMAHELGHAILHTKQNCYFIRNKTLLLNSKIEKEANIFAATLLISEDELSEYKDYTLKQLSKILGYSEQLIQLRIQ